MRANRPNTTPPPTMKAAGRKPSGPASPAHLSECVGRNRTARAVPLIFALTMKAVGREPSGTGSPAHRIARANRHRTARAVPLILGVTDVF
jgi:hypothetical protein